MRTKSFNRSLQILFLCSIVFSCAQNYRVDRDAIVAAEINNLQMPEGLVFASGQPSQEQVAVLANAGVRHVISLRTDGEIDWDEAALVESMGMEFHSIPVAGAAGVTPDNAATLELLLAQLVGQPVLVHCGTSNRVGALKAVTAHQTRGASIDDALAEGADWGLTGMSRIVRERIEQNFPAQ